jgi:hypothetical protein
VAKPGDIVFVYWSNPKIKRRGWHGPGVLLASSPSGGSHWAAMRGALLKVATEQLRRASDDEFLGVELLKAL